MNRETELLILFGLILITSGCINGGEETESEGDQAINVQELNVQPSEIYEGSSTTVNLQIQNTGEIPANLTLDSGVEDNEEECADIYENINPRRMDQILREYQQCVEESDEIDDPIPNYADRILTDRCRDFLDVEDLRITGPGDLENSPKYSLPERSEVRFTWILENDEAQTNVPQFGYNCNLRFQVPFDYSVTAYRQLQFKESREIEGTPDLESRSSAGPMMFQITTIGSTSDQGPSTFIDGDNAEVMIQLINQHDTGTSFTGFIDVENIQINAIGGDIDFDMDRDCDHSPNESLRMYDEESETIRCDLDYGEDVQGSYRGEVTASADYTYVQDLGSHEIEVMPRGR